MGRTPVRYDTHKKVMFDFAERLYIDDELTFAAVAEKVGVSTSTIRSWCTLGAWAGKRLEKRRAMRSISEDSYALAQELMAKIRNDLKSDGLSNEAKRRLSLMLALVDKLPRVREYERKAIEDRARDAAATGTIDGASVVDKIEEILG
jgi:hypothetical protein